VVIVFVLQLSVVKIAVSVNKVVTGIGTVVIIFVFLEVLWW
jgi:hypothetical protein